LNRSTILNMSRLSLGLS